MSRNNGIQYKSDEDRILHSSPLSYPMVAYTRQFHKYIDAYNTVIVKKLEELKPVDTTKQVGEPEQLLSTVIPITVTQGKKYWKDKPVQVPAKQSRKVHEPDW